MNRSSASNGEHQGTCGTLYVVSTPIGNMEDITLRALNILKTVDVIAAESVTHTKGLCDRHGITTRRISYNQHNQTSRTHKILRWLKSGQHVALVTNAGTPGISDPGAYLIHRVASEQIPVTPIPGPSAVISALSVSGMPSEQFVFLGFPPNKPAKRKKALSGLVSEPRTMVFFEAPHRIRATLLDMAEVLGNRHIVVLREMTKTFEDVVRGSIRSVLENLTADRVRGEFTLVVAGKKAGEKPILTEAVRRRMDTLFREKYGSVRDIAKLISKEEGIAYRRVYRECLSRKRDDINIDGTG